MLDRPNAALLDSTNGGHMCVADLIVALGRLDPKAPVMVGGPYGGFVDTRSVAVTPVRLNVNDCDGFGPHDVPGPDESAEVMAVVIAADLDR